MWKSWIYLTVALFILVTVWYTTTPMISTLYTTVEPIGNFTHTSTNTSYHNLIGYARNQWNMWIIAGVVVAFLMLFYFAAGNDKYEGRL